LENIEDNDRLVSVAVDTLATAVETAIARFLTPVDSNPLLTVRVYERAEGFYLMMDVPGFEQ
jgi:hypothetical protein